MSILQEASANAVTGILAALDDATAAALIARSCQKRPGLCIALRDEALAILSTSGDDAAESSSSKEPSSKQVAMEPRKRVRRMPAQIVHTMPRPGANGGEEMELAVHLLSGRRVATYIGYGNDLVAVMKAEIQNIEGTPVWQQQLLIDDCTLEDQESLNAYDFPESNGQRFVTMARRDFIPAVVMERRTWRGETPLSHGYSYRNGEHGLGYYAGIP